ncbi:cellulose-binding domain-containing protein [Glycomyces sp. TRM65418]|uniref:cellulose binding domain-containing protein n=1 Tax=Glycomyces sp. TRM65418 TaxID=2867006 RepID=UPI001CE6B83F|nr:cellulose binding domain-containing protein [Glycomyces sp. TRM65418]MCC3761824.1 cellulose-binding domain-containing protein [Glycomyces sp. TRM65418]QZD55906.1 cellulose-binding domain-containing protein [Glycomyces sp. TRM65418]
MRAMRNRPRRFAAVAAACAALAAGTIGAVAASPAHADACESIDYTVVSSWNGGHQAAVSLTAGTEAVNGWTIGFDLPVGAAVQSAWNVEWGQSGQAFTGSDVGWNASVAAGQTRELFGLVVSGGAAAPAAFTLDGIGCGAEEPTTSEEPTETPSEDPTTGPPADCPTGAVCDDFEDQAGAVPGGDWTVGANDCTGTGIVAVDTAVARSGDTSIRVEGGATYCNHVFIGRDLPADAEWFRVYMRHTTPQPQNHTTMIAMEDRADAGTDLRLGGQNGALQWNRESDDATLPAQSPAGVALSEPLPVGTWTCVEFRIQGGNLATWVDGALVEGLVVDGAPTHDVDAQWLAKSGWNPDLADLRLGWESYGDDADTLWYDDVAFGPERIGC